MLSANSTLLLWTIYSVIIYNNNDFNLLQPLTLQPEVGLLSH